LLHLVSNTAVIRDGHRRAYQRATVRRETNLALYQGTTSVVPKKPTNPKGL
jgi:hypothetical protein